MEALHKKVVDFDGDIPMDRLMQLQQKLKHKNNSEVETKGFVSESSTIKSTNQSKGLFMNVSAKQNVGDHAKPVVPAKVEPMGQQKEKQETISSNNFWTTSGGAKGNVNQNNAKTVSFDDFFSAPSSKPQEKQKVQSLDQLGRCCHNTQLS